MKNHRFSIALFIVGLIPMVSTLHAQTNAPPTGSTASVAPPPRPMPCTASQHRQFDFWIGDWDVTNPAGKPAGTNLIKPILGGCVLHESWVATGGGFVGQSFNTFDAARGVWHQTWVDAGGNLLLLEGRVDNSVMTLSDKDVPGKKEPMAWNEIAWTPNADGSLRQLWRTTADAGKSWVVAFDGKYMRAVRPQPMRDTASHGIALAAIYALGGKVEILADGVADRVIKIDLNRSKVGDADLAVLANFPDLLELDIRQSAVTDAGLVHLRGLAKLRSLNLFRNNITNAGVAGLMAFADMETLLIGGTKVDDAGLVEIAKLTKLKKLSVFQTAVSDASLARFEALKSLRILLYAGSKVTDAGVATLLKTLPTLQFKD